MSVRKRGFRFLGAACSLLAMLWVTSAVPPRDESFPPDIVVSTGGTKGVYHAYGRALAAKSTRHSGIRIALVPSTGSIENLRRLGAGDSDLAFSAADAVAELFAEGAHSGRLRAVTRLYDDYLHLVVPAESPVRSLGDLAGRAVSIGPRASGTALIATRLLGLADVPLAGIEVSDLGIDDSLLALAGGELDALFWSGGLPTAGVVELAQMRPIRLIAMDQYVDAMRERYGSIYRRATIPSETYRGVAETVTIAVPNYMVAAKSTPNASVRAVLELLFAEREDLAESVPSARLLDHRTAIFTRPLPMHAEAVRYFRSTKP